MELARRWLGHRARGLEIGASVFAPFPGVRAWNLDHPAARLFQEVQRSHAGRAAPIHVFGSGERLPLRTGALEFLLASHVIEHMPDAIGALLEWDRVLAVGGVLFLIVPHRDRTMDSGRPCTELAHHLADHALRTSVASDVMVPTSHYHVWRTADFLALVALLVRERAVDWTVEDVEDVDSRAGNGFTVVLAKRGPGERRVADGEAAVAFHHLVPALPFQVPGRSLDVVLPGAVLPEPLPVFRGRWRVSAIRSGFPPAVARRFELEVGARLPAPTLAGARWDGRRLLFSGRHLDEGCWLVATYPDGSRHPAFPARAGDELEVDLTGLELPSGNLSVVAVSPPPGGGTSAPLEVPLP